MLTPGSRRLNHVEFVHRPGEGAFAIALFEALGCPCHVVDVPPYGAYVVVQLDGSPHGENDMFVSQAEPEQLAFEDALGAEFSAAGGALAAARDRFRTLVRDRPFRATHVGIRVPTVAALDETIDRLKALASGQLSGRLELGTPVVRSPEEAESTSTPLKQIWLWTDVLSTGLLAIGQQFELQAYAE